MKAIRVRAYRTDRDFGYDRWRGEEYSCGQGTHNAMLIILQADESTQKLLDRLSAIGIREARTYEEKCSLG